jgi:CHAT domain-containing protein/Tfp pilus assembly protein PilF
MGRRFSRRYSLLPLLALLLLCTSAAAPTEWDAARTARTAINRAEYEQALKILDAAQKRFATRDSEGMWALRVLRAETLASQGNSAAGKALGRLPRKYERSETGVQWLAFYARLNGCMELLSRAEEIASAHVPALLPEVRFYSADTTEKTRATLVLARERGRPVIETKAMAQLAYLFAHEQRFADSVQWGERAVEQARLLKLFKVAEQAEGNLGWMYFELGDYETAAELFERAYATAHDIRAHGDQVTWLVQLGNVRQERRKWAEAARLNQNAVTLAREIKDERPIVGYALANMARIALEQGRADEAARFNSEALRAKKDDKNAERSSWVIEARIAMNRGDAARAEQLLEDVLAAKMPLTTRIEAEVWLAKLFVSTGRHGDARLHFERAIEIAREGRDSVKDRDLRFAFFNTASDLFDAYVDFLVEIGAWKEALAVTETNRGQSLREGENAAVPLNPTAIAAANHATILCYWLGRAQSYVWVITAAGVTLHTLPPDQKIEELAEAYGDELHQKRASPQARGKALFETLVAAAKVPKGSRVIIVADGQLHRLNFETLITPDGRYWIEDVTVINAPSLQLLPRGRTPPPPRPSMLLVGNAPSPDPSFPPLRFAQKEMERIAARFDNPTILAGARATPAMYLAAAREYDFVHLAAHGVASRKRPLDSAIILAAPDKTSSYKLLARDIITQPLRARLVTVSSCHGVGTRTYAGEGVIGLAWAFLKAGSDQVIAALWEVNDETTPALMEAMYSEIRRGSDPADALRTAKLRMVHAKGMQRFPRYWAPFVLYAGT